MKKHIHRTATVALFLAGAVGLTAAALAQPYAEQFNALVLHVQDGDTVEVLHPTRGRVAVRFTDIDAPEVRHGSARPGQPMGNAARAKLQDMVLNKVVRLSCYADKTYGRDICRVFLGANDIGADLVRAGLAWAYAERRYVRDSTIYQIQDEARAAHRGLWQQPLPVAPWDWRKMCWKNTQCGSVGEERPDQ